MQLCVTILSHYWNKLCKVVLAVDWTYTYAGLDVSINYNEVA